MSHVRKTDTCWEWTAHIDKKGYGRFGIDRRARKANRVAWMLFRGPIPAGFHVCHSCDNRKCVRPDHLWLGTNAQNNADMMSKSRWRPFLGSEHGRAKLRESDVVEIRNKYLSGGITYMEIAKMFGVSKSVIGTIIRRANWRHVS